MGQSYSAKRQHQVRLVPQVGLQAISASDHKDRGWTTIVPPRAKLIREIGARKLAACLVECNQGARAFCALSHIFLSKAAEYVRLVGTPH